VALFNHLIRPQQERLGCALRRSPARPRLPAVIASRRTEGEVIARPPANSSGSLIPIQGYRGSQPEQHVQAFGEGPPSTANSRSNGPPGYFGGVPVAEATRRPTVR